MVLMGCDWQDESVISGAKYTYLIPDDVILNGSVDSDEAAYGVDLSKDISLVRAPWMPLY